MSLRAGLLARSLGAARAVRGLQWNQPVIIALFCEADNLPD
jgi:hypothetical protein